MDHESPSVTGEREPKRLKQFVCSPSESSSAPSTVSSIPTAAPSTSPSSTTTLGRDVVSPKTSDPAKIDVAAAPIDTYNRRGIRSKACLGLLEGDHFKVSAGSEKRWVLPKRLVTSYAPFFASRHSKQWKFVIEFSNGEAFELFVQWLHLGELDFDGVDASCELLARAWLLGEKFECAAFKDHVMVQLIKAHSERGIDPRNFRRILKAANSGSKLHKWAIDQFHSKLTYGYTGYDDRRDGDHPNDKALWKEYATDLNHFGGDFLKVCLDAGEGVDCVKKPWEHGQQYMEVLSYAEIGGCKEEGRSTKAEATLTKAERR